MVNGRSFAGSGCSLRTASKQRKDMSGLVGASHGVRSRKPATAGAVASLRVHRPRRCHPMAQTILIFRFLAAKPRRGDVRVAEPFLDLVAISASCNSVFVAAVARSECTHSPLTSALMPVSRPYLRTMLRYTDAGSSGLSSFSSVRLFLTGRKRGPARSMRWRRFRYEQRRNRLLLAFHRAGKGRIVPVKPVEEVRA